MADLKMSINAGGTSGPQAESAAIRQTPLDLTAKLKEVPTTVKTGALRKKISLNRQPIRKDSRESRWIKKLMDFSLPITSQQSIRVLMFSDSSALCLISAA